MHSIRSKTVCYQTVMRETVGNLHPGHELDMPPWRRVESTIMATARLMRDSYDTALAPLDLNLTTASLLAYVVEQGPFTQTALAEQMTIGRAAAGSCVDRLEQRGLVERRANAEDRRVWLIAATQAGVDAAQQITNIDVDLRRRLRLGIDRHERQMLATLLGRLQRNLLSVSLENNSGQ
ncbi:MarR family transcriptional regulator [Acidimicrobiaceae bacterium AH-315-P05]|nr:MarR family transcriptional regulator [Acidimicrobiaceae bacterium AH-315-P05]